MRVFFSFSIYPKYRLLIIGLAIDYHHLIAYFITIFSKKINRGYLLRFGHRNFFALNLAHALWILYIFLLAKLYIENTERAKITYRDKPKQILEVMRIPEKHSINFAPNCLNMKTEKRQLLSPI